jgi:hypothetical protein
MRFFSWRAVVATNLDQLDQKFPNADSQTPPDRRPSTEASLSVLRPALDAGEGRVRGLAVAQLVPLGTRGVVAESMTRGIGDATLGSNRGANRDISGGRDDEDETI